VSAGAEAEPRLGWTAGVVRAFLTSKLSPLLLIGSLAVGAVALLLTPREEDPQIVVPVVDVFVAMPGASAREVELLAAGPLEGILREITGVENVYSMSSRGGAVVTVRFFVGEDREESLTKVFTQLEAERHRVPPGVPGWQVRPVDIDDVPIVTVALHSRELDDSALREIAVEVLRELKALPDVGETSVVGGRRREVRVLLDPARVASRDLSPLAVLGALTAGSAQAPSGELVAAGGEVPVQAGPFLGSAAEVAQLVVGTTEDADGRRRAVRLGDVAEVVEGPEEPETYTRHGFGPGAQRLGLLPPGADVGEQQAMVTLALAKRQGSNAVAVAHSIEERLGELRAEMLPASAGYLVTRDYGETADHKVNELVKHLAIAVLTVVVLLGLTLGWREAFVVALAVPMTLAVTLFADLLFGYSINRVTLFALILSLGLLVDDPIVDVENIYRHFKLRKFPPLKAVLVAVDEIRPPTVLATFTVIVSFLPMFFITGMMGPYMAPMAFNVPVAMLMSLVVAFTVTPWAAYHALRREYDTPAPSFDLKATATWRWYRRLLGPLLHRRGAAAAFLGAVGLLFVVAVSLVPLGLVPVKMLPFDNKDELLLVVDLDEGATLEQTDAALAELGAWLSTVPEVRDWQSFAGTHAPIDFNGLVRHYFLREAPNLGDVRVNLLPKTERAAQSHAIALRLRPELERLAAAHGALVKVVETPPGPPVLATLAVEVRGPLGASHAEMVEAARRVRDALAATPGVGEVDWMVEAQRERLEVVVDREKASLSGVSPEAAVATVRLALAGGAAGALRGLETREARGIVLRLPAALRADPAGVLGLRVQGEDGALVPLGEIASIRRVPEDRTIHHKDLEPVAYVIAEPLGISPVDALFAADARLEEALPEGYAITWRGEGEWKITTEVFRDLGAAFGAALLGIYVLLVAQTGSLLIPLVIMLAIPLTMIGVFPGFALLNLLFASPVGDVPNPIFFTAPGMIGLIALAGIVVRNSIILVDFVEVLRRRGRPLDEALIEAGATRLRPILLTAGAALFGAWVIVLDPIFSGLAWSFIFGIFASTAFTLFVIPTVYHLVMKGAPPPSSGDDAP
jgi:multidrug efflux pump subunit AcrB